MKRHLPPSALSLLAAFLLLAAGPAPAAAAGARLALEGLDPVALAAGERRPGDERFAAEHDGLRYLFASAESRDRFLAEPARRAIQGDGTCPVSPNYDADPSIFAVHAGRIFTFATPGCVERFRTNPDYYVAANVDHDEAAAERLRKPPRRVAILLFDGVELLDFAGPGEVFANGGDLFEVTTVAARPEPVVSQGFVKVTPEHTFATVPRADVIVVPGGSVTGPLNDDATIAWLTAAARDAEVVLSVCNGALVVARAGLLDGLEATTHHGALEALAQMAPKATVVADRRWVDNGRVVTSGGVSAGIDASLHVVERLVGTLTAYGIAGHIEHRWQRDLEASEAPAVRTAAAGP